MISAGTVEGGERKRTARQQRLARPVRVHLAELLIEQPPVDQAGEAHQLVLYVDDLIEPRSGQIILTSRLLAWPHPRLRPCICQDRKTVLGDGESSIAICREIHRKARKSCNARRS
jgi:hypothetical protein